MKQTVPTHEVDALEVRTGRERELIGAGGEDLDLGPVLVDQKEPESLGAREPRRVIGRDASVAQRLDQTSGVVQVTAAVQRLEGPKVQPARDRRSGPRRVPMVGDVALDGDEERASDRDEPLLARLLERSRPERDRDRHQDGEDPEHDEQLDERDSARLSVPRQYSCHHYPPEQASPLLPTHRSNLVTGRRQVNVVSRTGSSWPFSPALDAPSC